MKKKSERKSSCNKEAQEKSMNENKKSLIDRAYSEKGREFYIWLIDYLVTDINDSDRDVERLEILRYIAEKRYM